MSSTSHEQSVPTGTTGTGPQASAGNGIERTFGSEMSRRSVLRGLSIGGATLAGGSLLAACGPPQSEACSTGGGVAPVDQRILVLIEQGGGVDSLSLLVPFDDSAYLAARNENVRHKASELLMAGGIYGDVGINPGLQPLYDRGLAFVEGVGLPSIEGSHFEAADTWYQAGGGDGSGFLGRLCDEIGGPAGSINGMSVSHGHPMMNSNNGRTANLPTVEDYGWMQNPTDDDTEFVNQLQALGIAMPNASLGLDVARNGLASTESLSELIENLPEGGSGYDEIVGARDLGTKLRLTSQLIRNRDLGIRVVHLTQGGFDTHVDHRSSAVNNEWTPNHDMLIEDFGTNVSVFLDEMGVAGLQDQVVVATFSEFGRRLPSNENGTDHGWATTMMACGAVNAGRYGEAPSLTESSRPGNLQPEITHTDWLGTLADGWMGVGSNAVQGGSQNHVGGLFC